MSTRTSDAVVQPRSSPARSWPPAIDCCRCRWLSRRREPLSSFEVDRSLAANRPRAALGRFESTMLRGNGRWRCGLARLDHLLDQPPMIVRLIGAAASQHSRQPKSGSGGGCRSVAKPDRQQTVWCCPSIWASRNLLATPQGGHAAHRDITVGHHAHEPAAVTARQGADVLVQHHLRCQAAGSRSVQLAAIHRTWSRWR